MAPSLEQEVHLARRGCWKCNSSSVSYRDSTHQTQQQELNTNSQFSNGATINNKINDNNYLISNNTNINKNNNNNDNLNNEKSNYFKSVYNAKNDDNVDNSVNSKIFSNNINQDNNNSTIKFSSILNGDKIRNFFHFNLNHMLSKNMLLIIIVLMHVLLMNNCIVSARPNQSTVSNLVPSSDASDVSIHISRFLI